MRYRGQRSHLQAPVSQQTVSHLVKEIAGLVSHEGKEIGTQTLFTKLVHRGDKSVQSGLVELVVQSYELRRARAYG